MENVFSSKDLAGYFFLILQSIELMVIRKYHLTVCFLVQM